MSDTISSQRDKAKPRPRPKPQGQFEYPVFDYKTPHEQQTGKPVRHPVVIVGGGLVGLTAAIELGSRGIACVLIDDNDTVSDGSRSIAQAKRSLEIWNRTGVAHRMTEKGITWSKVHIYDGTQHITSFELFPEGHNQYQAFTSLPQYYVEYFLKSRCDEIKNIELRWLNRLVGITPCDDHVRLEIETPDGIYVTEADWVIAADGVYSTIRDKLGLPFRGRSIEDRYVIADVKMPADFSPDRYFWFRPPFYQSNSALRVIQPDSIWRVDWQLGPDEDGDAECKPERVRERLTAMFGDKVKFEVQWLSIYKFGVRRIDKFRHGRVFFAGDAAHQLSPFGGGRGGNSGVQDVDNLAWKLAAVIKGNGTDALLDSYDFERGPVADRNLRDSVRSTEFITPTNSHSADLRDAVLKLSPHASFAKAFVNTGRFAVQPILSDSPLVTPDADAFTDTAMPGTAVLDAPVRNAKGAADWLVNHVPGEFVLMMCADKATPSPDWADALAKLPAELPRIHPLLVVANPDGMSASKIAVVHDANGVARQRYDFKPGSCYLLRPDQHIVARWRSFDANKVQHAVARALGRQ